MAVEQLVGILKMQYTKETVKNIYNAQNAEGFYLILVVEISLSEASIKSVFFLSPFFLNELYFIVFFILSGLSGCSSQHIFATNIAVMRKF